VTWFNQGPLSSTITATPWAASFAYTTGTLIFDSNGNIEHCLLSLGTSGSSAPDWSTTLGFPTVDNFVVWENWGPIGTFSLAAAGGASGIIVDNAVAPGTQAGASQVYFSTLGNQACTGGGTGGCAVQASQSALQ
jgi:hypothetical protein